MTYRYHTKLSHHDLPAFIMALPNPPSKEPASEACSFSATRFPSRFGNPQKSRH